jgi:MFS family permease
VRRVGQFAIHERPPAHHTLGPLASYIGRKSCLYIAVALVYIANVAMMTTDNLSGLYGGRLVIGLGNGLLMTFSQLYIQV